MSAFVTILFDSGLVMALFPCCARLDHVHATSEACIKRGDRVTVRVHHYYFDN